MSWRSRASTVGAVLLLTGTGCKPKETAGATVDAAPLPEPAVEFVGRCINETPGTPTQSIFFFPKKNELLMYLGETGGAVRVPINVMQESPRKLDFTFRWSEKDKAPETRTGSVAAVGNKWQFELQDLKGSTCRPVPAPDYLKLLPALGIAAGKYQDPRVSFSIVVAADAQAWVFSKKGETSLIHYRVLEQNDRGILLASYGKTPSDADDESWAITRMMKSGDTLVHELQDLKLNYKLVAAAPVVK